MSSSLSPENHAILAKRWYQASVDCLNAARYQQYHNRKCVPLLRILDSDLPSLRGSDHHNEHNLRPYSWVCTIHLVSLEY